MERTSLYEDDLTEQGQISPAQREENSHTIALDPDADADGGDETDEEEDEDLDD